MPRVTIPVVGKYGVIFDRPPQELPNFAWSDSLNVRHAQGGSTSFGGMKQAFANAAAEVVWIQQYNQGGKRWWIHATATGVYADDGVNARLDITPTGMTASPGNVWTGGVIGGVLVANNGTDAPFYWAGTGTMATITAWPAGYKCASIRPFKNYLVAVNITKSGTNYPHLVLWSSEADPGSLPTSWDVTDKTKNAGDSPAMADDPSLAVDQLPLGDANILYKENAIYSMVLSGNDFIFNINRLPIPFGARGRNCVANTPLGHVVLTHGDVILHNGSTFKQIATGRIRKWLSDNIDGANRSRCFVVTSPRFNEVWICFPALSQTKCTRAAVWNWIDDTWSVRSLPNVTFGAIGQIDASLISVWDSDSDAWDNDQSLWDQNELSEGQAHLLMGCDIGLSSGIAATDMSITENGEEFAAEMERKGISFDDPATVKSLRAIWPRIKGTSGKKVLITSGATMDIEQAVTWGSPVEYTIGSSQKADLPFSTGRFLAIRFDSVDNAPFRVDSFDIDYTVRGLY